MSLLEIWLTWQIFRWAPSGKAAHLKAWPGVAGNPGGMRRAGALAGVRRGLLVTCGKHHDLPVCFFRALRNELHWPDVRSRLLYLGMVKDKHHAHIAVLFFAWQQFAMPVPYLSG